MSVSLYLILAALCFSVSCLQRLPRIVSGPSHPLIGKRKGVATFDWTFELRPSETWNDSIYEVVFGIWDYPGFLTTKLMVIDKHGDEMIRRNYENKINCTFNMSRLQVSFTLHNLSKEDQYNYGLHVEFGPVNRSPLTDTVKLRLEDPPEITNPLQRNVTARTGDDLDIKCQAKGVPNPIMTWTRLGRVIKNQTLALKRVRRSDSGVYLCKAYNKAGEDSKEVIVTVSDYNDESPQITVPSTPKQSSEEISPLWTSLLVVSASIILIMFAVLLLLSRGYCRTKIPYAPQIDTKTSI
ncbi:Hemicentin-1 [Desmophyllum pertusum]|uniref:Hemicentin-1 n=1 Tax=Desmophyllum pertusum TaxID=174260 RepID=A0A9W9YZ48_9CNID|nr:Hemicentin-1 [Desmophyllum pertusum]